MQQSESRDFLPQILRVPQVLEATGIGRSTLWRRVKDGSFPRPVRLGPQSVGWRRSDVADWIETRPAA